MVVRVKRRKKGERVVEERWGKDERGEKDRVKEGGGRRRGNRRGEGIRGKTGKLSKM